MKKILFYFLLAVSILLINTSLPAKVLNSIMGVEWSSGILSVIKQNSQGLVIAFLLSLYIDFVKNDKKVVSITKDGIEVNEGFLKILATIDMRSILDILLESKLNRVVNKGSVISLVDTILPNNRAVYYDVKVKYTLEDIASDMDRYLVKYDIEFKANINEYVLAIAGNGVIQELISSGCPQVSDVFTAPLESKATDYLNKLSKDIHIKKVVTDISGRQTQFPLTVSVVKGKNEYEKYLPGISAKDYGMIALFKADCGTISSSPCTYIVSTPSLISKKTDHFTYWIADRPMWIDHIEFDATKFTYNYTQNFAVQPVLINYISKESRIHTERGIHLRVNNWVVKGHGVIFSWR